MTQSLYNVSAPLDDVISRQEIDEVEHESTEMDWQLQKMVN
jgi:hypothetical protein